MVLRITSQMGGRTIAVKHNLQMSTTHKDKAVDALARLGFNYPHHPTFIEAQLVEIRTNLDAASLKLTDIGITEEDLQSLRKHCYAEYAMDCAGRFIYEIEKVCDLEFGSRHIADSLREARITVEDLARYYDPNFLRRRILELLIPKP